MIKKCVGIIVVGMIAFGSHAQHMKVFEDELGIKGEYRFSGTYSDTVLPKQGMLDIRWRELTDGRLKTYRIKGQTKEHLPVGKWLWEEAEWDYKVNAGAGIGPQFQAKGERMKWEGIFSAGQPEGKWTFNLDSISGNGKLMRSLMKIDVQFKKGKPVGTLSLIDDIGPYGLKLKGNCDAGGVATGIWEYTYKNDEGVTVKEEREYKQGLLIGIRKTEGGNRTELNYDKNSRFVAKGEQPAFSDRSRVGDIRFEQDEHGGIASELYHEHLVQYFQRGWKMEVFPFAFERLIPVFRRLEHPLTADEITDIADSRHLITKQKDTISRLLSGNISIHRSRSGELDTTIAFLQLNLSRLDYLDSILNRTEQPFFTYKDRYGAQMKTWIDGLNKLRFAKGEVYDSLCVELPLVRITGDSIFIFRELTGILSKNEIIFPDYFREVENAHISVKQEGVLKELETKIAERYAEQQSFYEQKDGIGAVIYSKWVKGDIQNLIQDYARSDEYGEALNVGYEVLEKLDAVNNWQQQVELFDSMQEKLKSGYTYLVYNPYTGENDIEVTNKKRFLNSILTNLWPYLLNEIHSENDWEMWNTLWERQFSLYDYLMAFASKEDAYSKRVDKRVRKEKKPERILKILLQ